MSKAIVTLVPKLREDYADEHAKILAEQDELKAELAKLSGVGGLINPAAWARKGKVKKRLGQIKKLLPRFEAPPGFDLSPPRVGYDEAATEWYRAELGNSEAELPLSIDDMIEEAKGRPIWALTDHPLLQQLGVDWPKQGYPIPVGPGVPPAVAARFFQPMKAEEAVEVGQAIESSVREYMLQRYPELASGQAPESSGESARDTARAQDIQLANEALSGAMWLQFWGGKGYDFKGMPAPPTG